MQVYIIRNHVNSKVYVGQTTTTLQRRFQAHIDNARKSGKKYISILGLAILKYGKDAFTIELLEVCMSQDELNAAECKWIEFFGSQAPKGYNIREGGSRGRHNQSTIDKLRSRVRSAEERAKIRAAHLGMSPTPTQLEALRRGRHRKRPGAQRGNKNPHAILNEAQVATIKRRLLGGEGPSKLAREYGVSQGAVSHIKCGISWPHVMPAASSEEY